ncbi:carbonate dehydratase [Aliikangiella marina]|uniref:Carbonic anhydrase 2 n=1 Tax=Aliikangiella marina TaxID=1712262 RepID=A0A545T931_9GAMM|nr:carbonate dehydratase [Aliikangiella marina]TQV73722.1 carbonate dehydratase [Aliikangiella marina]
MGHRIEQLLENNRRWAEEFEGAHPGIFEKLSKQQKPKFLWIGCSDSRVPANTIIGLDPGEVFVHRNVANIVQHTDLSALSVLEYSVNILKVNNIIVCGHYGCGGIAAAIENTEHGLVDNWLRSIKDIRRTHYKHFGEVSDEKEEIDLLCELNVVQQVRNVCHTPIIQNAWKNGHELAVHGVIYDIKDGILKSLDITTDSIEQIDPLYRFDVEKS